MPNAFDGFLQVLLAGLGAIKLKSSTAASSAMDCFVILTTTSNLLAIFPRMLPRRSNFPMASSGWAITNPRSMASRS